MSASIRANQMVTEGNTLLSNKEMEMVVMLCMNESFIIFMRKEHPHVPKKQFSSFGTVIKYRGRHGCRIRVDKPRTEYWVWIHEVTERVTASATGP